MLVPILIVVSSVILFIVTTTLNMKTKVPEGIELPEKCEGCTEICGFKESPLTEEVIKKINKDIHCMEKNKQGENNEG